ncbi:MAG: hypothetical protein QM804_13120 [Propionicimonas sp.]
MRTLLAASLTALALSLVGMPPAQAGTSTVQREIDTALATFPGGTQTSANTIEWEDGDVTLTLATEGVGSQSVGSCETGKYCVYSKAQLLGSKLSFSTCNKTYSTAALSGGVNSMANARSSGTVKGLNSSSTTLVTVNAGGHVNLTPTGITQVKCTS